MYCRTLAALVIALLPSAAFAQTSAPKDAPKEAPKVYVPGLEQFMNVILTEHNKLMGSAAKANGNWPLAGYELGEIKETIVMGDVQDVVPVFKNLPLAQMLDAVITKEICRSGEGGRSQATSRNSPPVMTSSAPPAMPGSSGHRKRLCRDPATELVRPSPIRITGRTTSEHQQIQTISMQLALHLASCAVGIRGRAEKQVRCFLLSSDSSGDVCTASLSI